MEQRPIRRHDVPQCPRCGKPHRYAIEVRTRPRDEAATVLFGGPGDQRGREIAFTCPETGEIFTEFVRPQAGEEIVGPADPSAPPQPGARPARPSDTGTDEYAKWIETSRSTALDFAKTMLT